MEKTGKCQRPCAEGGMFRRETTNQKNYGQNAGKGIRDFIKKCSQADFHNLAGIGTQGIAIQQKRDDTTTIPFGIKGYLFQKVSVEYLFYPKNLKNLSAPQTELGNLGQKSAPQ